MTYSPSTANPLISAVSVFLKNIAAEYAPNTKFILTENIQYDSQDSLFSIYCQTCNNRLDQAVNRKSRYDVDDLAIMIARFAQQHTHALESNLPVEPKATKIKNGRKFR